MAFEFKTTKLPGVVIIQPQVFGDSRGYFMECFKAPDFAAAGLPVNFVQENESQDQCDNNAQLVDRYDL